MKLYYLANARIPTEKAHGIQIIKMCEAFANEDIDVTLLIPSRRNQIKEDVFEYYGVSNNFKIQKIPIIDLVFLGKIGFIFSSVLFAKLAALSLIFKKTDVVYTRDETVAVFLTIFGKKVIWESHNGSNNFLANMSAKLVSKIVVISNGLKKFYTEKGVNENKIIVAPDAVDLDQFIISESKEFCKEKLGFSSASVNVVYTGHLYDWKGANVLAEAASKLPENFHIFFVGGTQKDLDDFKHKYGGIENIKILGKKPHSDVPYFLKAADVLVIPNSAKTIISKDFTSPMKLFEYMSSGTPIVASDMSSIREIVSEKEVYFTKPDDAISLAKSIEFAHSDIESGSKASLAKKLVEKYTWANRAKNILSFIKNDED